MKGHNGSPPLTFTPTQKLQALSDVLFRTDLTATQKLAFAGLVLKSDRDGVSTLKTIELQDVCCVKRKETIFAATKHLGSEMLIKRISERGQAGKFRIMPDHVAEEIEKEFYAQSGTPQPHQSTQPNRTASTVPLQTQVVRPDRTGTAQPDHFNRTSTPQPYHSGQDLARAYKESPKGDTLSNGGEGSKNLKTKGPHMNGRGFVISENPDLIISKQTIAAWKKRFPAIPDLEAAMSGLAAHILKSGPMHAGWQQPEAWMMEPLSKKNQEALAQNKVTEARSQRAMGKTSKSDALKTMQAIAGKAGP